MNSQPDFFNSPLPKDLECERCDLRAHLMSHGWQTRREICEALHWEERKLREVSESMGTEVVRCQLGFKLLDQLTRDDIGAAKQGADAFLSQAKKMEAYALGVLRKLHSMIG